MLFIKNIHHQKYNFSSLVVPQKIDRTGRPEYAIIIDIMTESSPIIMRLI